MSNETNIELRPYPSGFLGSSITPRTELTTGIDLKAVVNGLFNRSNTAKEDKYSSSVEINTIWEEVVGNTDIYNTFEFKQRILEVAIRSFGTKTLAQWISVQYKHPDFTESHHKFIDETILFVSTGKQRELTLNNWGIVLLSKSVEYNTPMYTKVESEYLMAENKNSSYSDNKLVKNNVSKTIAEFILDWIRQENGVNDLSHSLYLMFGSVK